MAAAEAGSAAEFCGERKRAILPSDSDIPTPFIYTEVEADEFEGGRRGGDGAAEVWRMNRKLRMEKNRAKKEKAAQKKRQKSPTKTAAVMEAGNGVEALDGAKNDEKKQKKERRMKQKKQKKEEDVEEAIMCEEEAYYRGLKPMCTWCKTNDSVKFRYFNNRYRTEGSRASSFDQPRFCCRSISCNGSGKEFSPKDILHYRDFLQLSAAFSTVSSSCADADYDVTLEELAQSIEADLEKLPVNTDHIGSASDEAAGDIVGAAASLQPDDEHDQLLMPQECNEMVQVQEDLLCHNDHHHSDDLLMYYHEYSEDGINASAVLAGSSPSLSSASAILSSESATTAAFDGSSAANLDLYLPMLLDKDVQLIDNILPGAVAAGLDSGIMKQQDQAVILQPEEDPAASIRTTRSCYTAEEATPGSTISIDQDHSWANSIIFPPLPHDDHHALLDEHDDDDAGPILYDIDLW